MTAPCGTPRGTLLSWWCRRCAATTASTAPPLRFLLKQNLSLKKKYEEEEKERKRLERRQVLHKEFFALADVPVGRRSPQQVSRLEALAKALDDDLAAHPSQPSKRKRKKKRKKRLPRSSVPRSGRPRRRQRQRRVSLRHVVDVPVVQFSSNGEVCADNYFYFRFKLNGKGRSVQWVVFLYCDKTIIMTVIARKCCPGVCLCLTSVVSASVRRPTLTRSTPFTSCFCHPSVAASRCRVVVDSALPTVFTILFGTG